MLLREKCHNAAAGIDHQHNITISDRVTSCSDFTRLVLHVFGWWSWKALIFVIRNQPQSLEGHSHAIILRERRPSAAGVDLLRDLKICVRAHNAARIPYWVQAWSDFEELFLGALGKRWFSLLGINLKVKKSILTPLYCERNGTMPPASTTVTTWRSQAGRIYCSDSTFFVAITHRRITFCCFVYSFDGVQLLMLLKQGKPPRHTPTQRPSLTCRAISKYNRIKSRLCCRTTATILQIFGVCTPPQYVRFGVGWTNSILRSWSERYSPVNLIIDTPIPVLLARSKTVNHEYSLIEGT